MIIHIISGGNIQQVSLQTLDTSGSTLMTSGPKVVNDDNGRVSPVPPQPQAHSKWYGKYNINYRVALDQLAAEEALLLVLQSVLVL